MNIKKLLKSFKFAGEGLISVFKTEQNFRIEITVSLIVVALMIYLPLRGMEIAILSLTIASVLTMEILNTAVERLLDMITKKKNKNSKFLKDIMASAVLVNVLLAIVIGMAIFSQYFLE